MSVDLKVSRLYGALNKNSTWRNFRNEWICSKSGARFENHINAQLGESKPSESPAGRKNARVVKPCMSRFIGHVFLKLRIATVFKSQVNRVRSFYHPKVLPNWVCNEHILQFTLCWDIKTLHNTMAWEVAFYHSNFDRLVHWIRARWSLLFPEPHQIWKLVSTYDTWALTLKYILKQH